MSREPRVLASFADPAAAARAIERAARRRVPRDAPRCPRRSRRWSAALGLPRSRLDVVTFPGALVGLAAGAALTVGTSLAWPLVTGGKPIVSVPPFAIVVFEVTVLVGSLTNLVAMSIGSRRGGRGQRSRARRASRRAASACARRAVTPAAAERILQERGGEEVGRVGSRRAPLCAPAPRPRARRGGVRNDWRTDMWYQPSIRPEDAPRPLPDRSVPLGAEPRYESRDDTEDLKDPVPATPESLARGTDLFLARCAPCHGKEGHGGGPVSKFFPPAPDLAYVKVRERTDGFVWGTISYGGKAMPPAREGLTARIAGTSSTGCARSSGPPRSSTVPPPPPEPPLAPGGEGSHELVDRSAAALGRPDLAPGARRGRARGRRLPGGARRRAAAGRLRRARRELALLRRALRGLGRARRGGAHRARRVGARRSCPSPTRRPRFFPSALALLVVLLLGAACSSPGPARRPRRASPGSPCGSSAPQALVFALGARLVAMARGRGASEWSGSAPPAWSTSSHTRSASRSGCSTW